MSLLGLMPGEIGGIPVVQPQPQPMGGLLGDPKVMLGLSLLANNNSKSFGQNLGRAGMQTLGAMQQMQQQQAMNDWRNATLQWRQRQMQAQDVEEARRESERQKQQQALDDLVKNNPNIDPLLLKVDPNLALKQAYPSIDQRLPQASNAGFFKVGPNNKVEILTGPDGKPLMPPAYDPNLSYSNAYQKGLGKANTTITDKQDGVLQTEAQLLKKVDPANGVSRTIQPPTTNNPITRTAQPKPMVLSSQDVVPRNIQNQRDMTAIEVLKDEYANETNPRNRELIAKELKDYHNVDVGGAGIRVPTKAEQAAAEVTAKERAKYNTPEAIEKREKAKAFKQTTAKNVIDNIDGVLNRVDGWSAGAGGNIMRALPINSDAKDIVADLETVKANFGFDRLQTMRDMSPTGGALGQVAVQELSALQASVTNLDALTQSPEQLKRNLQKAKKHYQNWLKTLDGTQQIMPSNEPMPQKRSREDILKQYGAI